MINPMLHALPPGTVLQGRYRISEALSPNKYLVYDNDDDILAVVTEFFPWEFHRDSDLGPQVGAGEEKSYQVALTDFLRRGRLAQTLLGALPTLVHVTDVFQANRTGYIAEEYIPHSDSDDWARTDLAALVGQRGPIPAEELLPRLEPVIRDLAEANRLGWFHEELTPDHLLVDENGGLRLTVWFRADELLLPCYGPGYGLLHEFIPEHVPSEVQEGKGWSPPGEVYSLCVSIYKCLTGLTPMNAWDRRAEQRNGFPTPGELGLLPPQQDQAIMKGLKTQPGQRWQSVEELRAALYRCRPVHERAKRLWAALSKGRGPKQVAPIHYIGAAAILSLLLTGTILWQRASAPPPDPVWEMPDLLSGLTEAQRALAEQGSFISGDLSYEFPLDGIPMVAVTGYSAQAPRS